MEKARRRHVPAFGEWNYYYSSPSPDEPEPPRSAGPAAGGGQYWWYGAPEPAASPCDVVWLRHSASPRPRRPAPKKARAAGAPEKAGCVVGGKQASAGVVVVPGVAAAAAGCRARDRQSRMGARRAVVAVRPVDEDLYRVPPPPDPAASGRPRRKRAAGRRTLWMGCLGGLGCVA